MKVINQSLLSHTQVFKERFFTGQRPEINIHLLAVGTFISELSTCAVSGGAKRDRTADLLRARQALSQLSYGPIFLQGQTPQQLVGLGRFELPTSPLSGVRSNQLSYRPNRLSQ